MSALDSLLAERRLIICVGPGGVGKTTTSAALAYRAARAGRRVAVITIDPARRLADALGLDGLDDALAQVEIKDAKGTLWAAMLDTKSSYDSLMARLTEGPALNAILANPIYQAFSRSLARSHAYVAAERLYEVVHSGDFDLIVLDTPPTRSALDILDSPNRLAQFLDDRVLRFFLTQGESGPINRLIAAGGRGALRILEAISSEQVVAELTAFFGVLVHLREGFQARARATTELLRDPSTAYVLVASAAPTSLADAKHLGAELVARNAIPTQLLLNRAYIPHPESGGLLEPSVEVEIDVPAQVQHTAMKLRRLYDELVAQQRASFDRARHFRDQLAPAASIWALPEAESDIRDLNGLQAILDGALAL